MGVSPSPSPLNCHNGYICGPPRCNKPPPPQKFESQRPSSSPCPSPTPPTTSLLRRDPRKAMKFEAKILSTRSLRSAPSPSPLKKTAPGTRSSKFGAENANPNLLRPADPSVPPPAAKPNLQEPGLKREAGFGSEAPASDPCVKAWLGMIGSLLRFFYLGFLISIFLVGCGQDQAGRRLREERGCCCEEGFVEFVVC